jgi:hypothetical protein
VDLQSTLYVAYRAFPNTFAGKVNIALELSIP